MMITYSFPYKICDSIHGFIRFDETEKKIIDSRPFQRLRYLHQMGVAYLVYPGATHARFEHSLGVMELATRIFDTLMSPHHLLVDHLPSSLPQKPEELLYWRRILRLAALCHDMGHLPFSHTAEKELLPEGGHEKMTLELIQSSELQEIWETIGPKAKEDILKLAVSEQELKHMGAHHSLSFWERILSKIITEDNFGADRIDYLIRDARHTGVGYGHFDYHQLIDSLRILPCQKDWLTIGVEEGGIQSVESLWIARYLMYARVYHHPKARLFSHYMRRFMVAHYKEKGFPSSLDHYLLQTDFTILAALSEKAQQGSSDAQVLLKLQKTYEEIPLDGFEEKRLLSFLPALQSAFPNVLFIDYLLPQKGGEPPEKLRYFSVLKEKENKIVLSVEVSQFLRDIPLGSKSLRLYAQTDKIAPILSWISNQFN